MREVDDDMSDLNVASAEEAYRQQNEQPKVVVKEVVKEVTKDTGRGTINALKGLYAGRTHKIVIVTGDRGTGITSTALNLAKQFSQKVPVLYFDCDVDNHGLLSYINYDNFRDYENIHMQGVKLATNGKAFNSCVCRFEDNLDLLTTDYSCDVTDEEIEIAGTTVAEVSGDYGVVIVDCPLDKLHLISDLIMIGNTVLCVEGSKRGFMNMLCRLENSPLPMRYKRAIVSKGNMFITKCNKNTDLNRLKKYINDIFMPTGADWMSMQYREFNGKLTDHILNEILE
jgi:cellulose biosynthesis protein BcsQ